MGITAIFNIISFEVVLLCIESCFTSYFLDIILQFPLFWWKWRKGDVRPNDQPATNPNKYPVQSPVVVPMMQMQPRNNIPMQPMMQMQPRNNIPMQYIQPGYTNAPMQGQRYIYR